MTDEPVHSKLKLRVVREHKLALGQKRGDHERGQEMIMA